MNVYVYGAAWLMLRMSGIFGLAVINLMANTSPLFPDYHYVLTVLYLIVMLNMVMLDVGSVLSVRWWAKSKKAGINQDN